MVLLLLAHSGCALIHSKQGYTPKLRTADPSRVVPPHHWAAWSVPGWSLMMVKQVTHSHLTWRQKITRLSETVRQHRTGSWRSGGFPREVLQSVLEGHAYLVKSTANHREARGQTALMSWSIFQNPLLWHLMFPSQHVPVVRVCVHRPRLLPPLPPTLSHQVWVFFF